MGLCAGKGPNNNASQAGNSSDEEVGAPPILRDESYTGDSSRPESRLNSPSKRQQTATESKFKKNTKPNSVSGDESHDIPSPQDNNDEEIDMEDMRFKTIENEYDFAEELGSSEFAVMFKGINKKSGEIVSIKCITKHPRTDCEDVMDTHDKEDMDRARALRRETIVLGKITVGHPNILRIFDSYVDDEVFYIVSDFLKAQCCERVFDYIAKMQNYTEKDCIGLTSQMASCVQFLHSNNVAHGDIRPEHFCIYKDGETEGVPNVKLKDLGFVKKTISIHLPSVLVWSCYSSPEVTQRSLIKNYFSSDMWSFGALLYEMLCGVPPFFGNEFEVVTQQIIHAEWDFAGEAWRRVSDNAKTLIKGLIVKAPEGRMNANDCAGHIWFTTGEQVQENVLLTPYYKNRFADLFSQENQLAFVEDGVDMFYKVGRSLGRGGFSEVYEGIHKSTGDKVAIKCVDKPHILIDTPHNGKSEKSEISNTRQDEFSDEEEEKLARLKNLKREILIMAKLSHPNVVKLFDVFMDPAKYFLVLELMPNCKELYENIVERGYYQERQASHVICQILSGMHYLHTNGVVHRDLKPENVLCATVPEYNYEIVKLTDFGFAKFFMDDKLVTAVGSPNYAAPELFTGVSSYGHSVDMWSFGVIIYVVLSGYPPFNADTLPELTKKILISEFDFKEEPWDTVTDQAKDLITQLIIKVPSQRLTTEECLKHPWIIRGQADIDANAP